MFCCGWGGNQFTPLLIMYRGAGYSAFTVDALLGAYVVGLVPGLLLSGGLSNRYGRKPVMLLGTVSSLLASVMLALGELGVGWLAAGRFVTGVAMAGTAVIARHSRPHIAEPNLADPHPAESNSPSSTTAG